jgi:hypothetical protein
VWGTDMTQTITIREGRANVFVGRRMSRLPG